MDKFCFERQIGIVVNNAIKDGISYGFIRPRTKVEIDFLKQMIQELQDTLSVYEVEDYNRQQGD